MQGSIIPCLRHTSLVGKPASASFRISTIWLSVNRDRFMRTSQPNPARKFYSPPVSPKGKLTLSDLDGEIAALQARRDKTQALKEGMMQQLLTGNIRIK